MASLLSDSLACVTTIAPMDPPPRSVEMALKGNSVLQLGSLATRFLVSLDPQCELNVGSYARLKRWLRVNIPDALSSQGAVALDDRRASFRSEAGLA